MAESPSEKEEKEDFPALSSKIEFGEVFRKENIRHQARITKVYNARNTEAWWKNSKISKIIGQDITEIIIEKGSKILYDNYLHDKLADYIINASFKFSDEML